MKSIKWLVPIVVVVMVLGLAGYSIAADAPKTITGTSSCGGCSGVAQGCCLLLTDNDGGRWVLKGDDESVKAAFKARSEGKKMTATLSGEPVTKKGKDGKDYKEVKVSKVKIES